MPSSPLAFEAPSLALLAAEPMRALFDLFAAHIGQPSTVQGDGHPVIVYPGLGAGALNTAQLRNHLQSCGFAVYDWELGMNTGPQGVFDDWLGTLAERMLEVHKRHGRKVSLVGWSLGGVYAREIAKLFPRRTRQVITLATPHNALGAGNHAGALYKLLGQSHLPPQVLARLRERPPVPTTSIYSRSDGIVSWRGCLEQPSTDVENIHVDVSHLGMPSHPDVLRVVADRLVQPEGAWRPYRRRRVARRS